MDCIKRLVVLLVFVPLCVAAQKKEQGFIDSVLRVLPAAKEDTSKVDLLCHLSFNYQTIDPVEGVRQGEEALTLAKKLGWKKGIAMAYNSIGSNYRVKSDYASALENFFNALKINEEIGDKKGIAQNSGNIGIIFKAQNDYQSAMKYYQQALDMSQAINDKKGVAINLGNIGILYNTQKQYGKALEYEFRSLELWRSLKNQKSVALWLGNIAIVYGDSGQYKMGLDYANQALAINEALGNKKGIADNCRSLGAFYYGIAKDTIVKDNDKAGTLIRAKENLEQALALATELHDLRNLQEINDILSKVHELAGEHKQALENYRAYVLYKDSIFSMESKKMIANLEAKRESELSKKEIELLNKEHEQDQERSRRSTIYFILGLVILFVISALLFSRYQLKQRNNVQLQNAFENLKETQQQLVQQEKLASLGQMTAGIAHEIQNPLNFVINFSSVSKELVAELEAATSAQEKAELMNMLKDNLAKIEYHGVRSDQIVKAMMMHSRSGPGEKAIADMNALCEEMINLANYSNTLENPGFNCRIERSFSPALPATWIVPQDVSKVILNLLNNAFYAVREKKNDAKISVMTEQIGDTIKITVKDNGPGVSTLDREKIFQPFFTTKPAGEGTGLGLSISFDMIKAHGGDMKLNSPAEGGAEFIVILPVTNRQ
jgi:two-component system NtrC family sensor kinase